MGGCCGFRLEALDGSGEGVSTSAVVDSTEAGCCRTSCWIGVLRLRRERAYPTHPEVGLFFRVGSDHGREEKLRFGMNYLGEPCTKVGASVG